MFKVNNQRVIITGGGSGLGRAMVRLFAGQGAHVIITGRRKHLLEEAVKEIEGSVEYYEHDVADVSTHCEFIASVEKNGPIDVLINNAGINMKTPLEEVKDEDFSNIINTNLNGLFALSREAAKVMIPRKRGCIINITSMTAIYGIPKVNAYTASKTGVLGLTRSMAVDLAEHGIRVNAIAPGFIDSPMLRKAFNSDKNRERRVLERTPMHKLGSPDDIAHAALFLASDAAQFITGVNLPVDGGNSIGF